MGKGGARHTTKPMVDVGLLFKVLKTHSAVVQNLEVYEGISKAQGASPAGLVHSMGLMTSLVELEPSCQIHQSSLRSALMQILPEEPGFNNSKFKGSIFIYFRMERIGVVIFHLRRLAQNEGLGTCAAQLNAADLVKLKSLLGKIRLTKPETRPMVEASDGMPASSSGLVLVEREEPSSCVERQDSNRSHSPVPENFPLQDGSEHASAAVKRKLK